MPWHTFYSYSHKDEELRDRLATYLAPLRQKGLIVEWHDRKIQPGIDWDKEISTQLDQADLVLILISPDFLASDYCFGVEVERAFLRAKQGKSKLLPILARPCLWEESRFSALQMIPKDAKPILSAESVDEALKAISLEVRKVVSEAVPAEEVGRPERVTETVFDSSLDLVRNQIHAYARLYEKTRQRMRPSSERTTQMESIFQRMQSLTNASYPLLAELRQSLSPGDRLAAVSILQTFADESSLTFLVDLIEEEKPFVGYHAASALRIAASALDSRSYPALSAALDRAKKLLDTAAVRFDSDRQTQVRLAVEELNNNAAVAAPPPRTYD